MKNFTILFVILELLISEPLMAREQSDVALEITSAKQGFEAKQDAFDQATEQASQKLVEDLLGPERASQLWPQIGPKLLKSSSRYVVFIKGSQPLASSEGTKVSVQLRLSPDAMEGLLRELGVYNGGSIHLLPLIEVSETNSGSKYVWWASSPEEKKSLAIEDFKKISQAINAQFKGRSTYVYDPTAASFRMGVPAAYRSEGLSREDQALLAQYLKAEVVLSGKIQVVRIKPDRPEQRIDYDLQLWQAKNGRLVAEVQQSEVVPSDKQKVVLTVMAEANKKIFSELAHKLATEAGSGNLNLNMMKLSILGGLTYQQQAQFRRELTALREVRSLKERLFEPQRIIYDVETQNSSADLAKALSRASFKNFTVNVESNQDDGLALSVRATSAQ